MGFYVIFTTQKEVICKMSNKKLLFLIIPLLYVALGLYFQQLTGLYSLRSIDPEYIYFISGLSVANGHLELGHIDNPGTPLQYFVALSFRLIYMFRSHEAPFIEDALAHSDFYLTVTNLMLISLIGAFLYFAGMKASGISQSPAFGILVQTVPFYTYIFYGNLGRVTPENLIPLPIILLCLLILQIIISEKNSRTWKASFLFSAVVAFGLSIKLTLLPIAIIPFFVIYGWKKKITYIFSTVGLFFLFALPATLQLNTFWNWTKSLFLNSGQYGSGKHAILDFDVMGPNLQKMWDSNKMFFIVLFFFLATFILMAVFKKNDRKKLLFRISSALIIATLVQIFMVSKHFEQRYFIIPLLIPLFVILTIELTRVWHFHVKQISSSAVVILLFVTGFATTQNPLIRQLSNHLEREQQKRLPAYYHFKTIEKDAVKILVPGYYNCPSPAYALRFSYGWAGKQKPIYKPYLAKLFPETLIYYFWDGTVNTWVDEINLATTDKPVHIYLEHIKHLETITKVLKNLLPKKFELVQTFYNEESNEAFYKITFTPE